ncbi:MAG: TonB-dependent receptor [Opitutaceae bacterium]
MTTRPFYRFTALLFVTVVLTCAHAAPVAFDIPPQPAPTALDLFVKQSGAQIVYLAADIKEAHTNAVKGTLEPNAALEALLKDTGIAATESKPGQFTIGRAAPKPGSVSGTLLAPRRREALAGVRVAVLQSGATAAVGIDGVFRVGGLPPGAYTLVAYGDGFSRLRITDVVVRGGVDTPVGALEMPVVLKDGEVQVMKEVVVSAKKEIETLAAVEVSADKMKPYTDRNVDLPRTINDVQAYHIFDAKTISLSGAVSTEDFLKQRLSMNTQLRSINQGSGNSFGQNSSINLRGAGLAETLVLVNGRERTGVAALGTYSQPDLNGIPLEAIDRIEVLPSSASAIYGGGAIGGVVNVILKSNFSGGSFKLTYENTFSSDAPIRSVNLNYGLTAEGGRTQFTFSGRSSDGKPLYTKDRPEIAVRNTETLIRNRATYILSTTTPFAASSSPNIVLFPQAFAPPGGTNYVNPSTTSLVLKDGTPLNALVTSVPVGTSPGTNLDSALLANAGRTNTTLGLGTANAALNGQIGWSPPKINSALFTLSRRMTHWLEAFVEYSLEENNSIAQFGTPSFYRVAGNNPLNPFRQNIYISTPSNLVLPNINNTITRTFSSGLKFDLSNAWRAQLDYTWTRSSMTLDFSATDSTAIEGAIHAGKVNPFVDTLAHPLPFQNYLTIGHYDLGSSLNDLALRAAGPVFRLPAGDATLAAGMKRKQQGIRDGSTSTIVPLTPANTSLNTYLGKKTVVTSGFVELNLPAVGAKNARPFLRELHFQLAGRADFYEVGTGTTSILENPYRVPPSRTLSPPSPNNQPYTSTSNYDSRNPTVGFKYKPHDSFTLRASYATAFVSPTFQQLVPNTVPSAALTTITDPRTNATYGVQTISGGNPELKPKRSKSLTVGAIVVPPTDSWLKGLRLGVEYFDIIQEDFITSLSAQQVVSGGDDYASRVTRDPTTGRVTLVDTGFLNLNESRSVGFDVTVSHRRATALGAFDFNATATLMRHDRRQFTPGGPSYEYVGYVNEGGPLERKGNATFSWQRGAVVLGWTTTHYDGYSQFGVPGGPSALRTGVVTTYTDAQGGYFVPSQTYHDLFASYSLPKQYGRAPSPSEPRSDAMGRFGRRLLSGVSVQAGIKNVMDTVPPFDAYVGVVGYYSGFGDPRLRRYWLSVQKDF